MLNQLNLNRNASRDLEVIESLSSNGKDGSRIIKSNHTKINRTKKGFRVRRKIHVVKKPKKNKGKGKKR